MESREIPKPSGGHPMKVSIEDAIKNICKIELDGKVFRIDNLTTGYAGDVFAVAVKTNKGTGSYVVKMMKNVVDVSFEKESNDDRVYGMRWSNLRPAYNLLSNNDISVPKIYSVGREDDQNIDYCIMELITGESVREFLAHQSHSDMKKLHGLVGEKMGMLHQITREFQGWVDMEQPYLKSWKAVFFDSIENRLATAAQKDTFVKSNINRIKDFIEQKKNTWVDPENFVLSHTDGFQGMAEYKDHEWKLTGIIDIEDHQFTDSRFVLAGHELSLEYEGREAPKEFWDGYGKSISIDPSYLKFKSLFQLYYLFSWLPHVVYDNWRGELEDRVRTIQHFEVLMGGLLKI